MCFSSSYCIPILQPQFLQNNRTPMSELRYLASVESLLKTSFDMATPIKSTPVEPTAFLHAVQWQIYSWAIGLLKWNWIPPQWQPPLTTSSLNDAMLCTNQIKPSPSPGTDGECEILSKTTPPCADIQDRFKHFKFLRICSATMNVWINNWIKLPTRWLFAGKRLW